MVFVLQGVEESEPLAGLARTEIDISRDEGETPFWLFLVENGRRWILFHPDSDCDWNLTVTDLAIASLT